MPILFSDLCLLFDRIARLNTPSHGKTNANTSRLALQIPAQTNANDILTSWLAALENTTHLDGLRLYRLVFPEHDIRRRYGLKETLLARELPQALGFISPPYLSDWKAEQVETTSTASRHGCFGLSLCQALQLRKTVNSDSIELTQLDLLLDELASHCDFSSIDVKTNYPSTRRRSRQIILNDLFRSLNAKEAAYLAQIILRDLSPLLYPVPSFISENALLHYNSSSYQPLELLPALSAWNWALPTIYKYRSDLDACFMAINAKQVLPRPAYSAEARVTLLNELACPIIPSASKGRSCASVAEIIQQAGVAYAEIKYDGERMQIHVNLEGQPCIKIFSKSKRDSTVDRVLTHPIVASALGLSPYTFAQQPTAHLMSRVTSAVSTQKSPEKLKNIILEAEMVAYNEDLEEVDEFANLELCKTPAVASLRGPAAPLLDSSQTQSHSSENTSVPVHHLTLVFFDILMLNDTSFVSTPYERRRIVLENVIRLVQGYVMLAQRTCFTPATSDLAALKQQLVETFAKCIVNRNEGLMIKMADSLYHDMRWTRKWIKLKRDYIPGLGDTISCCIVGASWSKERGRELRVPTHCYTTFHIGALENEAEILHGLTTKPRYRVLFSVSYFPDRPALLRANAQVHVSGGINKAAWCGKIRSNWQFDLAFNYGIEQEISFILERPLIFELFGAGFTRRRGSPYYELRFPRVFAIHHTRETSEAVSMSEMQRLGKDASSWLGSEAEDLVDDLWSRHSSTSGGESSGEEKDKESWRSRQEKYWMKKLSRADRTPPRKRRPQGEAELCLSPTKREPSRALPVQLAGLPSLKSKEELPKPMFWWSTYPPDLQRNIHLSKEHHLHSWKSLLQAVPLACGNESRGRAVIFAEAKHIIKLSERSLRHSRRAGPNTQGRLQVWLCSVPHAVQVSEGTDIFAPSSPFVLTKIT